MDFRQMQYIITVARYRSFTKAAEALYISQSALSHYIRDAENELGVKLFDRSTTPVSLTYAGRRYIDSAEKILLENDRLKKELRDITQHMSGKLTLGTSRDRASYMMPYLLPRFSERYPDIELEVHTAGGNSLMDSLRSGQVDLVLLPDVTKDSTQDFGSEHIYSEELVLATKKNTVPEQAHIRGQRVQLSALRDIPFFLMTKGHVMRSFCEELFHRNHIHPVVRMEFSSNISCYRMASTGMGITVIPFLTTRLSRCEEETELFSIGKEKEMWDVRMFYRKGAYLGEPEQALIRIAAEEFSNEVLQEKQ